MKRIFSTIFLLIPFYTGISQSFSWNDNCSDIYDKIFQFEFKEAKTLIEAEPATNNVRYLLENYIDFFTLVLEEDKELLQDFVKKKDQRLKQVSKGEESPYKRYIQAELNMHSGFLKMAQEEYMSAFWEIRKAYKLYEENERKYPDFGPNKKGIGILQMLIGTIPDKYQWGVKIVGLSGSIEKGAKEMEDFIYNYDPHPIQEEAKMLFAFTKYYIENDKTTAERMIFKEIDSQKGVWQNMVVANLSNAMGKNDFAIKTLEACPKTANSHPFPTIDLMLGICKLNRLDNDADIPLKKFYKISKSPSYKKEVLQKLAWHSLLNGNETAYKDYMNQILNAGDKDMDVDKLALQEAKQGFIPNVNLLKARLLFDGGYQDKALAQINEVNPMFLEQEKEQVEYNYRLGRIYQKLEEYDKAILIFENIIASEAKSTPYYFAPKVALELGGILEGRNDIASAKALYESVKLYTNHPYTDSFAQQAKTALKRLKSK